MFFVIVNKCSAKSFCTTSGSAWLLTQNTLTSEKSDLTLT